MRYAHIQLEDRNGITLMEVLIAIGILAIGLSSVAALMPAAGSQAKKAVVTDRAASMAENALADAVTIGVTTPDTILIDLPRVPVSPPFTSSDRLRLPSTFTGDPRRCYWNRIVIDSAVDPMLSEDSNRSGTLEASEDIDSDNVMDGLMLAQIGRNGIYGVPTAALPLSNDVVSLFSQGRDDLVYKEPTTADALPTNQINDTRAFLGRTSCLWALESLNGNPIAAQNTARLSAVLFHERDPSGTTFTATINDAGLISWGTSSLPTGRSIKEVFRRGTVVVRMNPNTNDAPSMYVLRASPAVSVTPPAQPNSVYAMADDPRLLPAAGTTDEVRVLLDSVGLAQKIVTLEGNSEYTLSDERKVTP